MGALTLSFVNFCAAIIEAGLYFFLAAAIPLAVINRVTTAGVPSTRFVGRAFGLSHSWKIISLTRLKIFCVCDFLFEKHEN